MQELADRDWSQPDPSRLSPDHRDYDEIIHRHRLAVESGEVGYLDPRSGLFVMTSVYLAGRGVCCSSGCRHCPYV